MQKTKPSIETWSDKQIESRSDHTHTVTLPIKSDGGSSTYYDIAIPPWLLAKITKDGFMKTEDFIAECLDNDFDKGTIFKSLIRAHSASKGAGKVGNDIRYESKKIQWSANKMAEVQERKT